MYLLGFFLFMEGGVIVNYMSISQPGNRLDSTAECDVLSCNSSYFGAVHVLAILALRCLSLILILAGIPFCLIHFIFGYSCLLKFRVAYAIFECQIRIILLYYMCLFL